MTHHILLSIDDDRTSDVLDALEDKLEELGLEMLQTQQNGVTLVSVATAGASEPVPVEEPAPVEELPPEPAAVEPEAASVPEPEDEEPVELAVKFESTCRVLDLSTSEQFWAALTEMSEVSKLFVSNVDTSTPGSVSFTHNGTQYKFPTTEAGLIEASIATAHKTKRIKLQVVEADADKNLPVGAVLLGASDAVLLTTGE